MEGHKRQMKHDTGDTEKDDPRKYLRQVEEAYIYDGSSGIYKPKSSESQDKKTGNKDDVLPENSAS